MDDETRRCLDSLHQILYDVDLRIKRIEHRVRGLERDAWAVFTRDVLEHYDAPATAPRG